jgi:hypothetical protein
MRSRTIIEAVIEVLSASKEPLSAQQIHSRIVERKLYEFKAKDPVAVMRAAIRKHMRAPDPASVTLQAVDRDRFTATPRASGQA